VLGLVAEQETQVLRRQNILPFGNKYLVNVSDGMHLAAKATEARRINAPGVLPQTCIPIDLVGEAVSGEVDDGHSVQFEAVQALPFLDQPLRCVHDCARGNRGRLSAWKSWVDSS
jgi:hypothetical protein